MIAITLLLQRTGRRSAMLSVFCRHKAGRGPTFAVLAETHARRRMAAGLVSAALESAVILDRGRQEPCELQCWQ